ncbi:hypothetical protein TREES_T100019481 [Tupaia chinensis]|uniref:Uncharacterized protein n=1 Tax=Tupaia chinensis TaxID=246437 RepID=L9KHF7_TUPCH|nr:hypothetical protein TREES_T100019481 [Tupaia chinensis]
MLDVLTGWPVNATALLSRLLAHQSHPGEQDSAQLHRNLGSIPYRLDLSPQRRKRGSVPLYDLHIKSALLSHYWDIILPPRYPGAFRYSYAHSVDLAAIPE